MSKHRLSLWCGLVFALAVAGPGELRRLQADDLKFPVAVGEYIDSGAVNSVYTNRIKLTVNSGANTSVTRGLIQLPTMPALPTTSVVSARLWLDLTWDNEANPYARGATLYPLLQNFHAYAASWIKSDTSLSTLWTSPGGTYDASKPIPWTPGAGIPSSTNTNIWCSWDLTSLWSNPDLFNNGAVIMFDQNEAQPASGFYTKQFSNATSGMYQGYVEVVTTPEPTAWALLSMTAACAGVVAHRRHRRRRSRRIASGR
jgi:hypothetical protein